MSEDGGTLVLANELTALVSVCCTEKKPQWRKCTYGGKIFTKKIFAICFESALSHLGENIL